MRVPWHPDEDEVVRQHYRDCGATAVATCLGRSVPSVHARAHSLGVTRRRPPAIDYAKVKRLYRQELSDTEIARRLGHERHAISAWRRRNRLPEHGWTERRRREVAARTREQLRRAGLPSLAALRVKAFRDFAKRNGWSEDLLPREVQVLNALWERGPLTKRQLCEAIGMPWKGTSRASLKSNGPGGSYVTDLMRRGLVVSLGRKVYNGRKGANTALYALALWVERRIG